MKVQEGDGRKTEFHYSLLLSIVLHLLSINANSSSIHQDPLSKCYHPENVASASLSSSTLPTGRD